MKDDESGIDLSIIYEVVGELTKLTDNTDKIVVIKSTVTPGTTEELAKKYPKTKFAFNPEFLTEANFLEDFLNADRTVIGSNSDLVSRSVSVIFQQRFQLFFLLLLDQQVLFLLLYNGTNGLS